MSAWHTCSHAPHPVHSYTARVNSKASAVGRPRTLFIFVGRRRIRSKGDRISTAFMKKILPLGAADSHPIS